MWVEHRRSWLHVHPVQLRHAITGRPGPEIAVETILWSVQLFFVGSDVHLLKFRHHGVEIRPQIFSVRRLGWVYQHWCSQFPNNIQQSAQASFDALLHPDFCSQLWHERDWCQRRNELLSSVRRHGSLEHQQSHHSVHATTPAGKSKTCTTLAEPIPPHVAVMLAGVTSPGQVACEVDHTIVEQLKFPPQAAGLQFPSGHELVPRSNQHSSCDSNRMCSSGTRTHH